MTSLYKISEQAIRILGKGEPQEIIELVKQAYSSVAKLQFYENKNDGVSEVNGSFVYTFKNNTPKKDNQLDIYYVDVPSSYLELPHEMGINQVSFLKSQDAPFVRLTSSSLGLFANLKSSVFGGLQPYYVESKRIYFPLMNNVNKGDILIKLAIALNEVDVDEELNISPNIIESIISQVVQLYAPSQEKKPDTLM